MAVIIHEVSPKAPAQPTCKEMPLLKLMLKRHEKFVYDLASILGTCLVTSSADKSL